MRTLIGLIGGTIVVSLLVIGAIWLLWWLFVVAAVVAVAGLVWRAVTVSR